MATKKPRIMITLEPRTLDALAAWGRAEGTSAAVKAQVFLNECIEPLEALAKVAQAGKKNIHKALESLTELADLATVASDVHQRQLAGLRHKARKEKRVK